MNHEPTYQIPPDHPPPVRPSVGRLVRFSTLALFTSGLLLVDLASFQDFRIVMKYRGIADAVSNSLTKPESPVEIGILILTGICIWTLVLDGRTLRRAPLRWTTIAYCAVGMGICICGLMSLFALGGL